VFSDIPSNAVLDRRDSRVVAEMEHYYAQTKQLIIDNRAKLDKLTARLIEEKTLLGDQVQEIVRCA
jgi:ATP-dependent Zn protease